MPEMTEKAPLKKQHRKKNRETHNAVERHRKKKINAGINRIGELIPCSPALKQSKNMILDQAYKYITEIKRQNDELLLNGGNNEQAEEIKKLRKQLDELQKENGRYISLLKANDICLYDDPTIHWKGNLKNAKVSVVIPNDQVQKSKENLKNTNVSVIIPGDQLQKNIIVYSNGSQLGGSNQGASVQGITFNISPNLQKQTANVVPVQRTCNLVAPVTISGIYSTEIKSGVQASVSLLGSGSPNSAPKILELPTSENEQSAPASSSAASSVNALQLVSVQPEIPSSPQDAGDTSKHESGPEHLKSIEKAVMPTPDLPSSAAVDVSHSQLADAPPKSDPRSGFLESCVVSAAATSVTPSVRLSIDGRPSTGKVFKSMHVISSSGGPASSATEGLKAVTEIYTLPATTLDKWPFPSSSGVGTSGSKSVGGLTRISTAGNTQTTWTTLQLAGNTVQPVSHAPSTVMMTPLLNEPVNGTSSVTTTPSKVLSTTASLTSPLVADDHTAEQIVVTLPSYPSVPMQPLVAKTQVIAQPAGGLLPLNPAMQVIHMSQPVGSPVGASPANQNVVILHPPNANPCPPVLRAEIPNQNVSQQIVIIQTANATPLSLFSAQPPVRMSVNGASSAASASNPMQNPSAPHMFGGKHLVHILPRPSSSPSSSLTQTFSVTMSNQQLPQTVSLNGQLFALKPVKSCSGGSDQTPMQIIQPTTSEDPNTNVALNTFGALASLNQSISQMAGQSCLPVCVSQPANPTSASSQTMSSHRVLLAVTVASSSAAEGSGLTSVAHSGDASSQKAALGSGSKWSNKNPSNKKCLVASSDLACQMNSKKPENVNVETVPEHSGRDILLENVPVNVVLQPLAIPQANHRGAANDVTASDSHPEERLRAEQDTESTVSSEQNAAVLPRLLPLESSLPGQLGVIAPVSTDCASPSLQMCKPQTDSATNLKLPESSKCIVTSSLTSSSSDSHLINSQISGTVMTSKETHAENVPRTEVSEICRVEPNCSMVMQATDLLEEQGLTKMLSDFSKVGEVEEKDFTAQGEHPNFHTQSTKSTMDSNDDLAGKQEGLLLMNSEEGNLSQPHPCTSEQEAVTASRQADSPMSTSSGSSCGFSVASMLPDTCRENAPNSTLGNTCNSCTFSEQTDIVALAARAIFDQETLAKGPVAVSEMAVSKADEVASLGRDQPFKSHTVKNADQIEAASNNFSTQGTVQINIDRPTEKQSCSVRVEMSNTTLQIPVPQSSSTSSLSINNLIHQSCIIHPAVSCSGLPSPSGQAAAPVTVTQPTPANSYMTQSPGHSPVLMTDYAPEQLSALRTTTMQVSQMHEPHLKHQTQESRKDSVKRSVQDDHLLSTSKRQKQCQAAPLQLEDMALLSQTASDIADHNRILVSQIPPNSSKLAVSVSSQAHTEGHSRLFPASNFVSPALRQSEVQCNPQPSVSEQAGQHLQPIQHAPSQGMAHLHSNHPYLKQQQQQTGQLRERHQLYQLQHHASHAEGSIHSQAHIVHQQRIMHQEAHMQKKRTLIQAAQPATLALQQKHHGNDQSRSKSSQPHPHHPQIQQMQQHYTPSQSEKSCENSGASRTHHNHPQSLISQDILHQPPPDVGNRQPGSGVPSEHVPGHSQMQRLMTSRALEQQIVSQPSIVTRPSDMTCVPHRQERNRVSSYSAEALIGKSPSNSEQRLGISGQSLRTSDHLEMRTYLDVSRNKGLVIHNIQGRISGDHTDVQRLSECQTFKANGSNQQPTGNFDAQSSRNNEIGNSMPSLRGMQTQAFRIAQNAGPPIDRQKRLSYQSIQGISAGNPLPPPRDNENTCHPGFMQSLLVPHLGDQASGSQRSIPEHQRNPQCISSSNIEYNCPPARESIHIRREGDGQNRESCDMSLGTINSRNNSLTIPFSSSSGDIQGRNSSPNISVQKSNPMRMTESHGTKGHMNTPVSSNVHGAVRPPLHHPPVSRGNADQVPPSVRQPNSSTTQRSRHPLQDNSSSKIRQPERNRSGNQRHGNVFDPSLPHLPLAASGTMILGRQQPTLEKRGSIVRFMPEAPQVSNDSTAPDQHGLSQNFGFSFIPEGGMNPPINANASFIPPVTQSSATRTPALIPVDPQNTLPSFYPPYSPAHPTLSNDISIPYFPNQMFPNSSTEKPSGGGLNNRFGSILSPPRPVGFAQPSFPLLTDMPPMHMANSSHLSNFNLTSLFPEIATALPSDGSAISPLLSIANTSVSDSSKQSSNRPAHNISHILGHDCSSAV
ncbi:basic helix-loop-helix domain-containing protein USF3 isoform X1 [Varanus komodoensis]|uniref:Upstream transcription factor family member 3 n=2 Tax=Varanus komodoensis TaxID=61221 RepID=A0A8D2IKG5_VARKO|nr:basic helix-loop-helix domain-containing protein USF3 isoform X1 [Varanus komodoensis]XP_044305569.1 basic helix-loop-helix domain-containing protein USF3 isoform X1 [Varanus komodoensis]XP_044305570.1 basic helix-loop-helix domain-containing protein USF3 isoform X1 [Varanus komodoensis]XP_044305571.1 basic helix-loop-helix domain-containing protein USF3 isoform X1 [Varanus komodoensis]XP_044305572.1 basic helix-loop-helix domain-containing protein USF3 isoform X1 [Varanus komodoensis]XP_04